MFIISEKKDEKRVSLKLLLGVILGLSFFFFGNNSVSAQTFQQPSVDSSFYYTGTVFQGLGMGNGGLISATDTGNIFVYSTSTQTLTFAIRVCFNGTFTVDYSTCTGSSVNIISAGHTINAGHSGFFDFDLGTATTTSASHEYAFQVLASSYLGITGTFASSYVNGHCDLGATPCTNLADIYFKIGNNLPSQGTSGIISITVPQNGSALLDSDFPRWGVQYNYSSTTIVNTYFGVRYGTSSTLTSGILNASYVDVEQLIIQGFASTTVDKTDFPPIGLYYAQAFIRVIPPSGQLTEPYYVATSSVIQFNLLSQGDPLDPPFLDGFGEGVIDWGDPCDATFIFSSTTISNLFACAFQPSSDAQNSLFDSINGFKDVFPFSLVFGLQQDTIDYFVTGTSTTIFYMPLVFPQGTAQVVIYSPTMFDDSGLGGFRDLYFIFLEALMWIGLGIFMYRKLT